MTQDRKPVFKNNQWLYITAAVMAAAVAAICFFNIRNPIDYQMYEHGATYYDRGVVADVTKESLEKVPGTAGRYLGKQEIVVTLKNGLFKGETVVIQHGLSTTHNIRVRKGQSLIIRVEAPEGVKPVFSVYNYDRRPGIVAVMLLFFAVTAAVGGFKGIRSIVGLLFTLFAVLAFLLPMIYAGYSPVLCSIITVVATSSISLILLNGPDKKTLCAVVSSIAGVAMTGVLFLAVSAVLHLSGYNLEETEELLVISSNTGLKVGEVLFAGMLISSLGAMMDMALSLSSSLDELKRIDSALDRRRLFSSGMNIGKDMIGTMSNTLILAFMGTAIVTLLVLVSYGVAFNQLMSSDYIAVEIAQGLSGATGVALTVPFTAAIYAALAGPPRKRGRSAPARRR